MFASVHALIVEQLISSVAADKQVRSYVYVANSGPFINTASHTPITLVWI